MCLIDDGIAPRRARRGIVFPVIAIDGHHALRRNGDVIAMIRLVITRMHQRVIFQVALYATRAGINQQLSRIKPVTLRWLPRPMHAVAITQTGTGVGQIAVPDISGARWQVVALLIARRVKHTQLNALGMGGKEREIHAMSVIRCAMRCGVTGNQLRHSASRTSQIVDSGGSVRLRDCGRPWLEISSVWTAPPFPALLPW